MKTKILITIFLILIGTVTYFAYPVFKNRYFQPSEDTTTQEESSSNKKGSSSSEELSSDENGTNLEDAEDESALDEDIFIDIDSEDCEDGCEQFEDADDKKYCQEYCGIKEENSTTNTDNCEELKDLEKDYCLKDQALAKKDFNLCKKITDKKILEACKTRLTEELINGSVIAD